MDRDRTSFGTAVRDQLKRAVALLLCCTVTWTSFPAWAEVAPTSNPKGQTPGQQAAANGVPVVDIVAPNARGISHNRYTRFDVGSNGLILNNSAGISKTELGGYIAGNANLQGGTASLILNEVTSASSRLQGYTEIAGSQAQLVIANPNGISCDGCGFLNTSRVTLTTGTPNLGSDGALNGFDVTGGKLTIGSNGLDAYNVDRLDLLSRQLDVQGPVWAKQLTAVAGTRRIGYDGMLLDVLPARDGGSPQVAIDVAYLGGMYADRIHLIATDAGVGVVSRGTLAAQAGDLQIDANGQVSLSGTTVARDALRIDAAGNSITQTGTLGSQLGAVTLRGSALSLSGDVIAAQGLDAAATAALLQRGRISAGSVRLAGKDVTLGGTLYSGGALSLSASGTLSNAGAAYAAGNATLQAAYLKLAGSLQSGGGIGLRGERIDSTGTLDAALALAISGSATVTLDGLAQAGQAISVHSGGQYRQLGQLLAGGSATLDAGTISVGGAGLISSGGALGLTSAGSIVHDGALSSATTLTLQAAALDNRGDSFAAGSASVDVAGTVVNSGSLVAGNGLSVAATTLTSSGDLGSQQAALTLSADAIALTGNTAAGTTLKAKAAGALDVAGVVSARDADLQAGADLQLAGELQLSRDLQVMGRDVTSNAVIAAGRDATLQASRTLDQRGQLQSGGKLTLDAATLASGGVLDAGGELHLAATDALQLAGTIQSGGAASLSATQIDNRASLLAGGALSVAAQRLDNRADATLAALGNADLQVGDTLANAGALQAAGDLELQAGSLQQTGSSYAGSVLTANVDGALDSSGSLIAGQQLTITADSLHSSGELGSEHGDVALSSQGDLTLAGTQAAAGGFSAQAGGVLQQGGKLGAGGALVLDATGDLEVAGQVSAQQVALHSAATLRQQGALNGTTVALQASRIENAGSTVASGDTRLQADTISVTGTVAAGIGADGALGTGGTLRLEANQQLQANGELLAGGDLVATADSMDLVGSTTRATGDAAFTAAGDVDHRGGDLRVGGSLTLDVAGTLDNGTDAGVGGAMQANALAVKAGALANAGGSLVQAGTGDTRIDIAGQLDNRGGVIASNGDALTVAAGALVNAEGRIEHAGTGTLALTTQAGLDNSAGRVVTQGQLDASAAGAINNQGGAIAAAGDASLTGAALDNSAGSIAGHALALQSTGGIVNNAGVLQAAGGALSLDAARLDNQAGTLQAVALDGVGGDLVATVHGAVDNSAGTIGASGDLTLSGTDIGNRGGTLQAGTDLALTASGQLDNSQGGRTSAGSALTLNAGGALLNANGQLDAGNTLTASAARIDNSLGRIVNNGAGLTQLTTSGALTNAGGSIGGLGNVALTAGSIANTSAGTLAAGSALSIDAASLSNQAGTIYAGSTFALQRDGATLDNRNGTLKAEQAVQLRLAQLYNAGGEIGGGSSTGGAGDVTIDTTAFDGAGTILAQNLLDLTLRGNYTNGAASDLFSNGTFKLTVTGALTNQGSLAASDALQLTAASIANTGTGSIASNATTLKATGAITNAGDISGNDSLQATAATIANTGSIIGGDVLLQANTLTNGSDLGQATGDSGYATGLIASTGDMTLLVRDRLLNRDAQIYSLGDIAIGAARNAAGTITTRTTTLDNVSGSIEAKGDILIAASALNNKRRVLKTETGPLTAAELAEANASLPAEELIEADTIRAPANATFPTRYEGHSPGTWRTYSVVSRDRLTGTSAESKIVAGGNISLSGSVTNTTSTIAAAGKLNVNQRGVAGLSDAMITGGEQVLNQALSLGQTVRQSDVQTIVTGNTNDCPQRAGAPVVCYYEVETNVLATKDVSSSYVALGATMSGAKGVAISGADIRNEAVGTDGRRIDGVALTGSGQQAGLSRKVSLTANGASAGAVDGRTTAASGNAGVSGGTQGQLLNLDLPLGGLYHLVGEAGATPGALGRVTSRLGGINANQGNTPGRRYLIETDPRFIDYDNFISSDYLLDKLGVDPEWTLTRLGDGFYEQQLVLDQITNLTGNRYLGDYSDGVDQYRALLDAGVAAADQLQLSVGVGLTAEQVAALTDSIVWMVEQEYQGQKVLVPVVYLAASMDLKPSGALLAGGSVSLDATNTIANSGTITGTDVSATAANLLNQGSIAGTGTVVLQASQDLLNLGGQIQGGDVLLSAGNNLRSEAVAGIGNAATTAGVSASGALQLQAGNDLTLAGTTVSAGGSAALLAGNNLNVQQVALSQDSGLLRGGQATTVTAGGDLLLSAGNDLLVQGASVHADGSAALQAGNDLQLVASAGLGNQAATHASVDADGSLQLAAGNDITLRQATVAAGDDLVAAAGHDLNVESVLNDSTTASYATRNGGTRTTVTTTTQTIDQQALSAGGNLVLSAGNDVNLVAAKLQAGEGLAIAAGNDITSTTLTSTDSQDTLETRKRYKQSTSMVDETVHGTELGAGGDIALQAGHDISLTAASATSDAGGIALSAGNDINLLAAQEQHDAVQDMEKKKKGFLSSKTTTTHDEWHDSLAVTSSLSGESVTIAAGNDVLAQGAQIVGTDAVVIAAGNDLTLETAESTHSESHDKKTVKSGLFGSGGIGFTVGKQTVKTEADVGDVTHTGSTVGSLEGDVTLVAGDQLAITGSDVMALQGDITAKAKDIAITDVQDTTSYDQRTEFKQGGLTASVSAAALSLAQAAVDSVDAGKKVEGDTRMQALAAASAGYSAYGAAKAVDGLASAASAKDAAQAANISVAITVGGSKSESQSSQRGSTSNGSTLQAGGDINLIATGGGDASNLLIRGSDISAGNNVLLAADHDITIEAGQSQFAQDSSSKSSSAAVGVAATYGSQGMAFGVTVSASGARGNANGEDVTQSNSHVTAGNTATVISGNDTTLQGAVLSADTVLANIGGDLNIESLQDTSTYTSKDKSVGGSATFGAGFSASASYSSNKVNGDYASVTEQSGIQAGDGGFDITVAGNTDLKGAVIASTQAAVDAGVNRLQTGTLTVSEIENSSSYSAQGVSLSGGYSHGTEDGKKGSEGTDSGSQAQAQTTVNNGTDWSWQNFKTGSQGAAAGYASKDGSSTSITGSGISGGTLLITDEAGQQAKTGQSVAEVLAALDRDVLTGDSANGLVKDWDGQQLQQQVAAGAEITATFGQQASELIGSYARKKELELTLAGDEEEAAKWSEGGEYRVAAHAVIGLLTGGADGALGSAASAAAAPYLTELTSNLPEGVKEVVGASVAAALGGTLGGSAGASTAFNEDANNRQLHPDEITWINQNAEAFAQQQGISVDEAKYRLTLEAAAQVDGVIAEKVGKTNIDTEALAFLNTNQNSYDWGQAFRATDAEYNSFHQYGNLLAENTNQFRQVYNVLGASGVTQGSLQQMYQSELLTLATSSRGSDGVAMLETFSGDVGMALGILRKLLQGDTQGAGTDVALAALPTAVGKIAGPLLRPLAKAAEDTIWLNGRVVSDTWVNAKNELTWVNPLTGAKEVVPATANVHVDHILPQDAIKKIDGFNELPASVKNDLLNDPANLQPMIASANCSKRCNVEGVGDGWMTWNGQPVSAEYKEYLQTAQASFREKIEGIVATYRESK